MMGMFNPLPYHGVNLIEHSGLSIPEIVDSINLQPTG